MVVQYRNKDFTSLCYYIKNNIDEDFYITSNNQRLSIKDENSLKVFLKESRNVMITHENGDIVGVIATWKSIGNGITRHYIKLNSLNEKVADKLLTVFLWNNNKDLYMKIKKSSKLYKIFKNKQFNFKGDRGTQTLLMYSKINSRYTKINHREKEDVSNDNKDKN